MATGSGLPSVRCIFVQDVLRFRLLRPVRAITSSYAGYCLPRATRIQHEEVESWRRSGGGACRVKRSNVTAAHRRCGARAGLSSRGDARLWNESACQLIAMSRRKRCARINRAASLIRDSTTFSEVLPRPSAARSQVRQIQASPAMKRCRPA